MNPWRIVLATLVIYGAGVITGGLLVNFTSVRANTVKRPAAVQALNPWQVRNHELLRRLESQLDLDPTQRTNIEQILSESQERTKALWRPIVPQMNREMQSVRQQIRAQLNPGQQERFDILLRQRPGKRQQDGQMPGERRRLGEPTSDGGALSNPAPVEP